MPGMKPCPATVNCDPLATGSGVTQHVSEPVRRGPPPLSSFRAAASGAVRSALTTSMATIRHGDLVLFAVFMCSPSSLRDDDFARARTAPAADTIDGCKSRPTGTRDGSTGQVVAQQI